MLALSQGNGRVHVHVSLTEGEERRGESTGYVQYVRGYVTVHVDCTAGHWTLSIGGYVRGCEGARVRGGGE